MPIRKPQQYVGWKVLAGQVRVERFGVKRTRQTGDAF